MLRLQEKNLTFMSPTPTSFDNYLVHIDTALTQDTPIAFGLHPNAEIDFRTTQSNRILMTILDLQPRDASSGEHSVHQRLYHHRRLARSLFWR